MKGRMIRLGIVLTLAAVNLFAQDVQKPTAVVSDDTAYMMILVSHSRSLVHTEYQHNRIGLNVVDHTTYDRLLHNFRSAYDGVVSAHNAAPTIIAIPMLKLNLRNLVNAYTRLLQVQLSPDGFAAWQNFVQTEKGHMNMGSAAGPKQ